MSAGAINPGSKPGFPGLLLFAPPPPPPPPPPLGRGFRVGGSRRIIRERIVLASGLEIQGISGIGLCLLGPYPGLGLGFRFVGFWGDIRGGCVGWGYLGAYLGLVFFSHKRFVP